MEPKPAATVIVARPGGPGIEILALRRASASRFQPGFVVFPGGSIDPGDGTLADRWFGDRAEAARACALRELYEEAGVLLTASGPAARPPDEPAASLRFQPPPVGALVEVARWVAPAFLEVRFDATFFATPAPAGLEVWADGSEIDRAEWRPPAEVLAAGDRGDHPLAWPTRVTLEALARCESVRDVLALRMEQEPPPR
jgi:8-oxo-dGTP pyrophosphatase MutT (NUDIX family)